MPVMLLVLLASCAGHAPDSRDSAVDTGFVWTAEVSARDAQIAGCVVTEGWSASTSFVAQGNFATRYDALGRMASESALTTELTTSAGSDNTGVYSFDYTADYDDIGWPTPKAPNLRTQVPCLRSGLATGGPASWMPNG